MKQHWLIMALAVGMVALNISLLHLYPVAKIAGDEPRYIKLCHQDSSWLGKLSRLIPGNMCYEWQPPLPYGVYGLLATDQKLLQAYQNNEMVPPHPGENGRIAHYLYKVSLLNILFFLIVGINIYFICILLGFGRGRLFLRRLWYGSTRQ